MDKINLSPRNIELLRDLLRSKQEIEVRIQLLLQSIINQFGDGGDYELSPDLSCLVKKEEGDGT